MEQVKRNKAKSSTETVRISKDLAQRLVDAMQDSIKTGNEGKCIEQGLLKELQEAINDQQRTGAKEPSEISSLGLPTIAYKALRNAGIDTIESLLERMKLDECRNIRGFGPHSRIETKRRLLDLGYDL